MSEFNKVVLAVFVCMFIVQWYFLAETEEQAMLEPQPSPTSERSQVSVESTRQGEEPAPRFRINYQTLSDEQIRRAMEKNPHTIRTIAPGVLELKGRWIARKGSDGNWHCERVSLH